MEFNILNWLLGQVLSHSTKALVSAFTDSDVNDRLKKVVFNWAESLPENNSIIPESMSLEPNENPVNLNQEARKKIINSLRSKLNPNVDEWHSALYERWNEVRKSTDLNTLQPFYRISPEAAEQHLAELAKSLQSECDRDKDFFQITISNSVRRIETHLKSLKNSEKVDLIFRLGRIEKQNYTSAQSLHFSIHNFSDASFLFYDLSLEVLHYEKIKNYKLNRYGAPISEIKLEVSLEPKKQKFELVPIQRYHLIPKNSDFFITKVYAVSGYKYLTKFTISQQNLESQEVRSICSTDFWLEFPNTGDTFDTLELSTEFRY